MSDRAGRYVKRLSSQFKLLPTSVRSKASRPDDQGNAISHPISRACEREKYEISREFPFPPDHQAGPLPGKLIDLNRCSVVASDGSAAGAAVSRQLDAGDRVRSNIAHELGYWLLQADGINEEKAAQRFAAAFSAPRQVVMQELGVHRNKLTMAELQKLPAL